MPELRFALLGAHPLAKAWYAAIEQSDRHHIVAALASDVTGVSVYDHWQPLAADDSIDAGLLFFPCEELIEAMRQLATRGKGVVIDAECELPSSLVAELGLLDAEAAAAIVPFFEWRAMSAFHQLQQLASTGQLGELVLVRNERTFHADGHKLDEQLVGAAVFSDIDRLRWIGGDYSQVTLFRTGVTDYGFAGQTLNLSGDGLPDATCVYRAGGSSGWTCEVQGTSAIASVHADGDGMRLTVNGETVLLQEERLPEPDLCLRLLDEAMSRRPGSLRWQDRVRIHEIQEAMQRSLKRRRTIDLHFETTSERSQFKTQMATVGCFVLVYTFFASVLLLLAGAVLDPRDQLQRQAEAAGFVVPQEDFDPQTSRLTPRGERRLEEISERWENTAAVVVVEGDPEGAGENPTLSADDRARLESVRQQLSASGVQRVQERTIVRRLAGQGFQQLMTIGRVIVFAPLGLFLLLQVFLLAARPAQHLEP